MPLTMERLFATRLPIGLRGVTAVVTQHFRAPLVLGESPRIDAIRKTGVLANVSQLLAMSADGRWEVPASLLTQKDVELFGVKVGPSLRHMGQEVPMRASYKVPTTGSASSLKLRGRTSF